MLNIVFASLDAFSLGVKIEFTPQSLELTGLDPSDLMLGD